MSTTMIGAKLRQLRDERKIPLRRVASIIDIDVAILSKMERGERRITKEIVHKLAEVYDYNLEELLILFLSDRILYEIGDEDLAMKALQVAENQLEYKAFKRIDRNLLLKSLDSIFLSFSGIQKAWIYGSFARMDDGPKSDIDIALKTDPTFSYFDLAEFQHKAEEVIHRKVDVGFIDSFKPYIWEHVKPDLQLIYEKG